MSGNIAINADSVLTMGEASTGVTAVGTAIDVQIADTVRTSGDKATCIFARTNFVYRDTVTIPDTTWLAPGPRAASPVCLDLTD